MGWVVVGGGGDEWESRAGKCVVFEYEGALYIAGSRRDVICKEVGLGYGGDDDEDFRQYVPGEEVDS